jgi:hypothetical protein
LDPLNSIYLSIFRFNRGGGAAVKSPADILSRPWWVGLGVVLTFVVALVSIFLISGGTSNYSNNGPCVAQGNNNTVNCPSITGAGQPQTVIPVATPTSPVTPIYLEDLSPTGNSPLLGVASIQGHMFPHSLEYEISLTENQETSTFALNGRYRRFRAYLGIDPRDSTFGSPVTFDIYVDDRRVSAGSPIDPNAGPCALDVSVTNATSLTLQMTIGGEGLGRIYAAFGDARLIGAKDILGEPTLPACAQNPDPAS